MTEGQGIEPCAMRKIVLKLYDIADSVREQCTADKSVVESHATEKPICETFSTDESSLEVPTT